MTKRFLMIIILGLMLSGNAYAQIILNRFDPDDEIEVNIQEFDGKQIVNVKILDRVLN